MIVAAHQPHFIPWLGYLDRMVRSDLFVIVDHVQFERRDFQNRTLIRLDDHGRWLTVPVHQRSQKERILDKIICNGEEGSSRSWGPAMFQTIRYAYRNAPHFERYSPALKAILEKRWERLVDLNRAMLGFLREAYDIRTPLAYSSDLEPPGTRSEMLVNLSKQVGASAYVGGMGGSRRYLDVELFESNGIRVVWHEFEHPRYKQIGTKAFIPGLSAIDLLFNHGEESRRFLGQGEFVERIAA